MPSLGMVEELMPARRHFLLRIQKLTLLLWRRGIIGWYKLNGLSYVGGWQSTGWKWKLAPG